MKRDYLVDAGNRITDFHDKGKAFVNYLTNHIAHLISVRTILDEEIEKYSRLRNVVDQAATNDNKLANEMTKIDVSLPKTSTLDDDFTADMDGALKDQLNHDVDDSSVNVTQ